MLIHRRFGFSACWAEAGRAAGDAAQPARGLAGATRLLRVFGYYMFSGQTLIKHWSNTLQPARGLAGAASLFHVFDYLYILVCFKQVKHWSNTLHSRFACWPVLRVCCICSDRL